MLMILQNFDGHCPSNASVEPVFHAYLFFDDDVLVNPVLNLTRTHRKEPEHGP